MRFRSFLLSHVRYRSSCEWKNPSSAKGRTLSHYTQSSPLTSLSPFPYLFPFRGRGVGGDRDYAHATGFGSYFFFYSCSYLSLPPPPPAQIEHGHHDGKNSAGSRSGRRNCSGERGCDRSCVTPGMLHSCLSRIPQSSSLCLSRRRIRDACNGASSEGRWSDDEAHHLPGSPWLLGPGLTGPKGRNLPCASESAPPQRKKLAEPASLAVGPEPSPAKSVAPMPSSPPSFS